MPDQEQNAAQTQETAAEDYAAWEVQRNAELSGESAAGEEKPKAEIADESETAEEKKEPEGEKPEGDEPDGEDEEEEKPKEEGEKPKRKGGFGKKIDKLTRRNSELARQNEELAARLAALENGKPAEGKPAAEDDTDDAKPKSEDFESFDEFTEALTDWKLRQHAKAQEHKEAEAKAKAEDDIRKQKAAEGWNGRVAEARKQFEDYDEVLEDAADIEVPRDLEAALLEAGPAVIYHLAKHREEAERIAKLPTSSALREIGKIEAKLATQPVKEPTPKPQPKQTQAPKPAPSLSGTGRVAADVNDPSLANDFSAWSRARDAQLKRK